MEKEFVPYELAVKLKELGFIDKGCFGEYRQWDGNTPFLKLYQDMDECSTDAVDYEYTTECLAPLWQQTFDWFRKIGYEISILRTPPEMVGVGRIKKYSYFIWKEDDNPRGNQGFEDTYEEAKEKCLKVLISYYK